MTSPTPSPLSSYETEAIRALIASDGWSLLRRRMDQERALFIHQLASANTMSESELHWRRGVLWAAERLLQMPELFLAQLENELILKTGTRK